MIDPLLTHSRTWWRSPVKVLVWRPVTLEQQWQVGQAQEQNAHHLRAQSPHGGDWLVLQYLIDICITEYYSIYSCMYTLLLALGFSLPSILYLDLVFGGSLFKMWCPSPEHLVETAVSQGWLPPVWWHLQLLIQCTWLTVKGLLAIRTTQCQPYSQQAAFNELLKPIIEGANLLLATSYCTWLFSCCGCVEKQPKDIFARHPCPEQATSAQISTE